MTDLNTLSKNELNALLASPLSASQLKKTSKDSLIAMFDAMPASDALDADLRDARSDDEPTPPTLTDLEKHVLVAYLEAGIDCNGCETLDDMLSDNMTWGDVPSIAKATGLTQKQVQGVISSLSNKGLLVITDEGVNGEGPVQQVLSDNGLRAGFELMAEGVEAKAPKGAKSTKAEPAPKKERKPAVLDDRIIVEPATDLKHVKATNEGTKRHLLVQALRRGATMEHLCEILGWSRDVVSSAIRWDLKQMGLGCERKGGKYHLIFPAGVNSIPLRAKDQTRAEALIAACK